MPDNTPQSLHQKLQWWLDQPPGEILLHPTDQQDRDRCLQLISKIRLPDRENPRFKNPALIGLGAFGLVFSAVDEQTSGLDPTCERSVAIKWLRPSTLQLETAKKRFAYEVASIASLKHPNIIHSYEHGSFEDVPYLVTDLADHGSLGDFLEASKGPIPHRQAAWLMMKIAEAIHAAHSSTIIHRDIKPGNILLRSATPHETTEALGLWPLLTDFGLAKDIAPDAIRSQWTQAGQILGTTRYMSPEQIRGELVRTQTDIFSLGIVLYELLCGNNPFTASSDFGTRENIVNSPPNAFAREYHIPRDLRQIVLRCLQKAPEDRYQTASALATDLNRYLAGLPLLEIRQTAWKQVAGFLRTRPILSSVVLAVLATLLISGMTTIALLNGEWKKQQALVAREREANKRFIESISITNEEFNDAVLSGSRIPPPALLKTLSRQIELLEEAFRNTPENVSLANTLQVMYHYSSIVYYIMSEAQQNKNENGYLDSAIHARIRSLDLIEGLIKQKVAGGPADYNKHLRNRIVGEHGLGLLYSPEERYSEKVEWQNRTIDHAKEYLNLFPKDLAINSLLYTTRIERASVQCSTQPQDAIAEMEDCIDYFLTLRVDGVLDIESTSHILAAYCGICRAQCAIGNVSKELDATIDRGIRFCQQEMLPRTSIDWRFRDQAIDWILELSVALNRGKQWSSLRRCADAWIDITDSISDWSGSQSQERYLFDRNANRAIALACQMISQRELGQSTEYVLTRATFQSVWQRLLANPSFPTERLKGWMKSKLSFDPEQVPIMSDAHEK
jgi:serine/threonine protein kinase